jgi:hypothetical protein
MVIEVRPDLYGAGLSKYRGVRGTRVPLLPWRAGRFASGGFVLQESRARDATTGTPIEIEGTPLDRRQLIAVRTTRTRTERNPAMLVDALEIASCTSIARTLTSFAPPLTFAIRELTSRLDCAD